MPPFEVNVAAKTSFPLSRPEVYYLQQGSAEHKKVIEDFVKETEVLQKNMHPNVVMCYGYTANKEGIPQFILMEKADTSLEKFIQIRGQLLEDREVYWFCHDILEGLCHLHEKNMIHRDIKPDNILLFQHGNHYIAKLGDLGLGLELGPKGYARYNGGAIYWSAPEALTKEPKLTLKSDIYSFGVMVAEMVVLEPFDREARRKKKRRKFLEGSLFRDFIDRCVAKNPQKRFTAETALRNLEESWNGQLKK